MVHDSGSTRPSISFLRPSCRTRSTVEDFKFLDLPPEIRLLVYRELLILDEPIQPIHPVWRQRRGLGTSHARILETCRLIHREAAPIFYGTNVLWFGENLIPPRFWRAGGTEIPRWSDMHSFFRHIGSNRQYLTAVLIDSAHIPRLIKRLFILLKRSPALRDLRIGWWTWYMRTPESLALMIGPLVRSMSRAQKREKDKVSRDVLDGLHIEEPSSNMRIFENRPNKWHAWSRRAVTFEQELKALLRKTLN